MALRHTQKRLFVLGSFRRWLLNRLEQPNSHPVHWEGSDRKYKAGYHWLEWRYTPSLTQLLWYNVLRVRWTGEVMVGKDWRDNVFFVKLDDRHPMKHQRFARFNEPWEMKQDYDADHLWKMWLEYRVEKPPTPQQCARAFKYKEERYNIYNVYLKKQQEKDAADPPEERIRRYQEYRDQKWDMRVQKATVNRLMQQRWLWARHQKADIAAKDMFSRWRGHWEGWNFFQLDLLRPPSKQRLWKLEDDMRTWRFIDAIENPKYLLNPYEKSLDEMYLLTPSHVAGEPMPQFLQAEKKPTARAEVFAPFRRMMPVGTQSEMAHSRVSDDNPFPHFLHSGEFDEWFAEQRRHLVTARAELEQMKRDGFRPLAIGGDLDPYQLSKEPLSQEELDKQREQLLIEARDERSELERRKSEAARRILGFDPKDPRSKTPNAITRGDSSAFTPLKLFETAVRTEELGDIAPGSAKQYSINKSAESGTQTPAAMPDPEAEEDLRPLAAGAAARPGVVSVFDRGSLFGARLDRATPEPTAGEGAAPARPRRPDEVSPL
eukprot:TRINITY_DN60804_c0_g1_i1.p1 TRINITY_DN60804_c0_g1~~TRINITY_DN60804_c0_g1_i1.p1  ORF type:complete len:572 (+),score=192.72 TRINITY_DN60804_c0_g1_i1:79-1716(+)